MYLMFPAAIATSFAFMLPVATGPNAVVFSYGYVKVVDMVMLLFYIFDYDLLPDPKMSYQSAFCIITYHFGYNIGERGGSVVEFRTSEREVRWG